MTVVVLPVTVIAVSEEMTASRSLPAVGDVALETMIGLYAAAISTDPPPQLNAPRDHLAGAESIRTFGQLTHSG